MVKHKRKFKGVWIPREIWLNEGLSLQEKVFIAEIDSLDCEKGCWANNNYFAKFFGLSKGRVSAVIAELIKKGWVESCIDKPGGNKRILHIVTSKIQSTLSLDPGIPLSLETGIGYKSKRGEAIPGKRDTPIPGNSDHNNTNTNNKEDNKNNIKCIGKFKGVFLNEKELALELEKERQAKKKAAEYELRLFEILPARNAGERTTYNRLREHLTKRYLAGDRNIFFKVNKIAEEVRVIEVKNRRGLFIAKCKKATGFVGRKKKLL